MTLSTTHPSSTLTTKTVYCLRHKTTLELARTNHHDDIDPSFGTDNVCFIVAGSRNCGLPRFEVDTPEKAAYVLAVNTPGFNSTPERPTWMSNSMASYEVVKLVTTVEITPEAVELPVKFRHPIDNWCEPVEALPASVELPANHGLEYVRIYAVGLEDGETLESIRSKCQNKKVILGEQFVYYGHAYDVIELPTPNVRYEGKPAVGIVTRAD